MPECSEIARILAEGGVRRAFTVPSIHNLAMLQALDAEDIALTSTRTELGAAHMADGYARVSGEPTVLLTSTGPGAGNATGGFATAAKDGSPVVHVSTTNFPRGAAVHGLHTVPEQGLWATAFGSPVFDLGAGVEPRDLIEPLRERRPISVLVPTTADRAGACIPVPRPDRAVTGAVVRAGEVSGEAVR